MNQTFFETWGFPGWSYNIDGRVRDVTTATLLARLPELGSLTARRLQPWSESHPSIAAVEIQRQTRGLGGLGDVHTVLNASSLRRVGAGAIIDRNPK